MVVSRRVAGPAAGHVLCEDRRRWLALSLPGARRREVSRATRPGIDVKRGHGELIVVEPSMHLSGKRYSWLDETEPWTCGLPRPRRGSPASMARHMSLRRWNPHREGGRNRPHLARRQHEKARHVRQAIEAALLVREPVMLPPAAS